jgi:phage shock protein C
MNKIISINLCSIIFQIDEIAYESLKKYLNEIKMHLGNSSSAAEVYLDVENRIAELFQQKINDGAQAILPKDIEELIAMMGQPEQFKEFAEENNQSANSSSTDNTYRTSNQFRRLYRNADDKVLGGVCSGLAAYFGIDPILIRLALAALFFIGGGGFLIYIICWIAIPKAETAAEKMAMFGKPLTFDDIKKNVEREAGSVKQNFERMGSEFRNPTTKNTLHEVARTLIKVIAFIFLVFGLMIFVPLAFALIVVLFSVGFAAPLALGFLVDSATDANLLVVATCCMVFIPIVVIVYKLIRLIFKTQQISSWIKSTITIVWFASIISIIYVVQKVGADFKHDKTITEQIAFTPNHTNTIYINSEWLHSQNSHRRHININVGIWGSHKFNFLDTLANGNIELELAPSKDSLMHLIIEKSAQGSTDIIATKRANEIVYNVMQKDSILILPHYFTKPSGQQWRNQEVRLTLQIPANKQIAFNENALDMIDDDSFQPQYEDFSNSNKLNTKWIITSMGLKEAK